MSQTFRVLSELPLHSSLLSADQAIWYTALTCPRRLAKYLQHTTKEGLFLNLFVKGSILFVQLFVLVSACNLSNLNRLGTGGNILISG